MANNDGPRVDIGGPLRTTLGAIPEPHALVIRAGVHEGGRRRRIWPNRGPVGRRCRGLADRLRLRGDCLREGTHDLAERIADRVHLVVGVVVAVEDSHHQLERLVRAEHQGREAKATSDAVAAVWPAEGFERNARFAQDADVPARGTLGDAELVAQTLGGDSRAALDQFECQQGTRGGARIEQQRNLLTGSRTSGMERSFPRMTQNNVLNTTIDEPTMTAGELEMLTFALERSRAQFAWKVGGLDSKALHRTFPPSTMTLAGLIKHLALVEDSKVAEFVTGEPIGAPWDTVEGVSKWEWGWRSAAEDTPDELYALWTGAVDRSRAAWNRVLADGGLDQPSTFVWHDGSPNLRRVLVDVHDEYARHVGHADLMREAIDGLVGEDPPQP